MFCVLYSFAIILPGKRLLHFNLVLAFVYGSFSVFVIYFHYDALCWSGICDRAFLDHIHIFRYVLSLET